MVKIKENHQGHLSFSAVEVENVEREIGSLDAYKVSQQNYISVKMIKANLIFFLNLLCIILTKVSLVQGLLKFSKVQRLHQF